MNTPTATQPAITGIITDNTMRTLSGKVLDLRNPNSEMIDVRDISSGLANNSHFAGQTPYFFSIAQHSVMVCDEFAIQNPDAPDNMKLLALLHDAAEAYVGDVIKPLKVLLPFYSEIESNIMLAIAAKYDLPIICGMPKIKSYDLYVQNVEYNAFYRGGKISYMDPEQARRIFLDRFAKYYKTTSPNEEFVTCAKCELRHRKSERKEKYDEEYYWTTNHCPRCGDDSIYKE